MDNRAIALVEWNWTGHHPYFYVYFAEALLKLGWTVVGLCPQPDEARDLLQERLAQQDLGHLQQGIRLSPITKTKYRLSNRAGTLLSKVSRADWVARRFIGIERRLGNKKVSGGARIAAILYPCIYDVEFRDIRWVDPFLRHPWSGLYVHAKSIRIPPPPQAHPQNHPLPETLFSGRRCMGIGLLDEGIVEQISERTGKPVIHFPDVTDARTEPSAGDDTLTEQLREYANGRKIVGLFGHLVRSKGILTLIEAAKRPEMQDVCFAFGGKLSHSSYTASELQRVHKAFDSAPNIWAYTGRIASEVEMNRLIRTCDVLAACYTDFPHSSNILSKAAFLRRPVIVNDGHLMAERVAAYSLGRVVPQCDVSALCAAIAELTADDLEPGQFGWDRFSDLNSFESFESSVANLVQCTVDKI